MDNLAQSTPVCYGPRLWYIRRRLSLVAYITGRAVLKNPNFSFFFFFGEDGPQGPPPPKSGANFPDLARSCAQICCILGPVNN